ncbi:MAG TPA: hypothetical protein VJ882_02125 [Desulfuromonadales bacterium]|nr:hypothetical protein [Desulfuromonadales bacterium]
MTHFPLAVVSAFTVVAVVAYNLWAYCCGLCAAENFVRPGPFGLLLTGVTVLAGIALLILKAIRIHALRRIRCRCGVPSASEWSFCPRCGISLKHPSDTTPSA